jgi:hypothetical protein
MRVLDVRLLLGMVFLASMSMALRAGGDSRNVADELIGASKKVLIQQGLCKDEADCTAKKLLFFDADRRNVVYLHLYDVHDIEVVEKIASICLQKYDENQRRVTIVLLARERPHREYGIWRKMFENPFIEVRLRGE